MLFIYLLKIFRFAINVGSQNAKGIHMRRGVLNKPEEFNVTIQPVFLMDKKYGMNQLKLIRVISHSKSLSFLIYSFKSKN